MVLNLHLQGGLGMAAADIFCNLSSPLSAGMPGRKLLSAALGAPPSSQVEDLLCLGGMELAITDPMATSSQASPGEITLEHAPNIVQVSHSPAPPTVLKTLDVASICPSPQSWAPQGQSNLPAWWGALTAREMNAALEWLLTTKATLNSCWRQLVQNAEIATCQNEAQTTKAIKEVEVWCVAVIREVETHYEFAVKKVEAHCTTQPQALKQSHEESMLKLEHGVLAGEGCSCWAFVEVCGAAMWGCPFKAHGVLMYPL